jgi:hypothetical protein
MILATLAVGLVSLVFASGVMVYVSVVSGIGPWIAPALVILFSPLVWALSTKRADRYRILGLWQGLGAQAGLVATAVGFVAPTAAFLDPERFALWLANPSKMIGFLALLIGLIGAVGLVIGHGLAHYYLSSDAAFPVSRLVISTIHAHDQKESAQRLALGAGIGGILVLLRDGLVTPWGVFEPVLRRTIRLFKAGVLGHIGISVWPTIWAIGLMVGGAVVLPFSVGLVTKFLLPIICSWIDACSVDVWHLRSGGILVSFCSGLIISELILQLPQAFSWAKASLSYLQETGKHLTLWGYKAWIVIITSAVVIGLVCLGLLPVWLAIAVGTTPLAVYHMGKLGVGIGFVPFGRFATLVMLPALLIGQATSLEAVLVSLIVSIAGATAVNLVFQYHIADQLDIDRKTVYWYQWYALVIGACATAAAFWLLSSRLHIGSPLFIAYRGRARALLISALDFSPKLLTVGVVYGVILRFLGIGPSLVFGGLIMPVEVVITFILGALSRRIFKSESLAYPLASGIFLLESLWVFASLARAFS